MEEKEIMLDGKEVKVTTKIPKEEIEDNSMKLLLNDTVELNDIIKEINKNE